MAVTYTCTNGAWNAWTTTSSASIDHAATTCSTAWTQWNAGTCTNVTVGNVVTNGYVYDGWVQQQDNARTAYVGALNRLVSPAEATARRERQLAHDRQREEWERGAVERAGRVKAVQERAERLLMSVLTPAEQRQMRTDGHVMFTVEGGDQPARHYKVRRGSHGNIKRCDASGRELESWCVQPSGVPVDDVVAAQIVHLKYDEASIRAKANITQLRAA